MKILTCIANIETTLTVYSFFPPHVPTVDDYCIAVPLFKFAPIARGKAKGSYDRDFIKLISVPSANLKNFTCTVNYKELVWLTESKEDPEFIPSKIY